LKKNIALIGITALSVCSATIALQTNANASTKYRSTPAITRGSWNPKWVVTPTLSSKNFYVYSKSVKINGHSYKLKYAKKTSSSHYTLNLKKHKAVKIAYKVKNVENRKNVKTLSVKVDLGSTGYDGLFYKGNLYRYPYKDTNFIQLDSKYKNGLPSDYIIITGKTLPNATVYSDVEKNDNGTVAHSDGHFTLRIERQINSGNKTITITSERKSAKTVKMTLKVIGESAGNYNDYSDDDEASEQAELAE